MLDLSDELRRLVDTAAPPIQLSELELGEPERAAPRTSHARRLALAALAVVAVAAGATIAVTRTGDGDGSEVAATGAEGCGAQPEADLEVFMAVDATPDQLAAARAFLADAPGTEIVRERSKQEAHQQFRCIFADNPDLVDSIDADDLPPSFLVRADDPAALREALQPIPGVVSIESRPAPTGGCAPLGATDLRAYFPTGTSGDVIAATLAVVEEIRGVTSVATVTPEQAYEHFSCIHADNADLLEAVTLDELPPSLLVVVEDRIDEVRAEISALPDIASVSG